MIIDKFFWNGGKSKKLRIQPSTDDDQVMFLLGDDYIFLEREQVERVRDFLTKFLDGSIVKGDDEYPRTKE